MMKHKVYVTRSGRGLGSPGAFTLIRRATDAALKAEGIAVPCEVSVMLTDDEGIREINREFRDIDRATDVLSFPQFSMSPGGFDEAVTELDADPETGRVFLGDMALSLLRAREQGAAFGHGEEREITYLTVHSILHLLGYDHVDEGEDKRLMREREKEIMSTIYGDERD